MFIGLKNVCVCLLPLGFKFLKNEIFVPLLKFEFVCVSIAPGGLDGCFGFGAKVAVPETAERRERIAC